MIEKRYYEKNNVFVIFSIFSVVCANEMESKLKEFGDSENSSKIAKIQIK